MARTVPSGSRFHNGIHIIATSDLPRQMPGGGSSTQACDRNGFMCHIIKPPDPLFGIAAWSGKPQTFTEIIQKRQIARGMIGISCTTVQCFPVDPCRGRVEPAQQPAVDLLSVLLFTPYAGTTQCGAQTIADLFQQHLRAWGHGMGSQPSGKPPCASGESGPSRVLR